MLNRWICALALVLVACKEEPAPPAAPPEPVAARPPAPPVAAPVPDAAPPPPPPLPTDAKELAELRKKAILDAHYDVAVKVCAAEDVAKIGEQSILSCVLAACRENEVEKAQTWAKLLKGPLKMQAQKICKASNVPI